ncbi:MAG: hypothetical protein JNK15_15950 [Planctomycetes bacterium]|nr:hypothetical protein [Planctomycetota bacterium]
MTAVDDPLGRSIDATFGLAGLLLRVGVYFVVGTLAQRHDCGPALLAGTLLGDFTATVVRAAWSFRTCAWQSAGELVVLAIVIACCRGALVVPECQAQRAILGLAAFGVFAGRFGKEALARLGRRDDGW